MKINISEIKLDTEKLNKTICMYELTKEYSKDSFLIMNTETLEYLKNERNGSNILFAVKHYATYFGIKIAICEALQLGEIYIK